METVCEYNKCAGCMACVDICPKGAITIKDDLQAYNAVIDSEKCVGCNACHRVCQQNYPAVGREPIEWKQGWVQDAELREKCSSGGVATAISRAFVENGGIVCSCVFREGQFIFEFAERAEEVNKFTGSKYVKSNPVGIYRKIKRKLRENRRILFIGLPCQVSALKNFIGPKCNNLYTIDLICHGTPSPKVLNMFLKQYGTELTALNSIRFRRKAKFQLYGNEKSIITNGVSDRYSIAFLNSLTYTENCYSCSYAKFERISDLTLGDSWGSDLSEEEAKKGISLILCQTNKGLTLLENSKLVLKEVDIEHAIESNHQLKTPSEMPTNRAKFMEKLINGGHFDSLVYDCFPNKCIMQNIKKIMIKLHIYRGGY